MRGYSVLTNRLLNDYGMNNPEGILQVAGSMLDPRLALYVWGTLD